MVRRLFLLVNTLALTLVFAVGALAGFTARAKQDAAQAALHANDISEHSIICASAAYAMGEVAAAESLEVPIPPIVWKDFKELVPIIKTCVHTPDELHIARDKINADYLEDKESHANDPPTTKT
jgi:hypothetical protein